MTRRRAGLASRVARAGGAAARRLSAALAVTLMLAIAACGRSEPQPPAATCSAIALGEQHGCAVCTGQASACWGVAGHAAPPARPLDEPLAVAAASRLTCAIEASGARCWRGDDGRAELGLPGAWEALSAFDDRLCVLGQGTVRCAAGPAGAEAWSPPGLAHPRRLAGGDGHVCVLDDAGVRCWSVATGTPLQAPVLAGAIGIAAGSHASCSTDGRTIACADTASSAAPVTIRPSPAGAVRSLTMNAGNDVCALVAGSLQCWGAEGQPKPGLPVWRDLKQVSAGDAQICGLGAEGRVRCWATAPRPGPRHSVFAGTAP